jgi:RecA-family ATPase
MAKRDPDDVLREQGPDALRAIIDAKIVASERARKQARANGHDPTPPLPFLNLAALDGKPVPRREWLVENRIPGRTVTLLTGDGGVGKSMLAKQLAIATVLGRDWLGTMPEPGPVIFLTAEDDEIEVHIRLSAVVAHYNVSFCDLGGLHLLSLAGKDAALAIADRRNVMQLTPLYHRVATAIGDIKPRLVAIDTVADTFLGDENNRSQVRQYVSALRGLAVQFNCAVLLLAHPSLTGINTGSGMSGSTAWNNSVRSRMYLKPGAARDSDDDDPNSRELELMKANYAQKGERLRLRWHNGLFVMEGSVGSVERAAAENKIDGVFLSLLAKLEAHGMRVSPFPSSTYAPKQFAAHPDAGSISKRAFEASMQRLLNTGRIHAATFGPPSRARNYLVLGPMQGGLPL